MRAVAGGVMKVFYRHEQTARNANAYPPLLLKAGFRGGGLVGARC